MNGKPLVSLIVPIYKVEAYLDRCVASIVRQTYSHLEIILVDDGSPDGCPKMCDDWARKDTRIRVIHKENGGLSDARNAGLAVASGEYIGFIDSDDWIEPMFVQHLAEVMKQHGCDMASCKYRRCTEENHSIADKETYSVEMLDRITAMSELINCRKIAVVVWNKLYRRELIDGILFEKGKYHEDEFWTYQVIGRINRIAVTDYIGYNYFQRADSIMGEGYSLKRLDAVEAKERWQVYLEENMPELTVIGRINLAFTCMYHGQQALRRMRRSDQKQAFALLKRIMKEYPVSPKERRQMKATWQIWYAAAHVSLPLVCTLRNLLRVGF